VYLDVKWRYVWRMDPSRASKKRAYTPERNCRSLHRPLLCHLDRSAASWRDLRFSGPVLGMFFARAKHSGRARVFRPGVQQAWGEVCGIPDLAEKRMAPISCRQLWKGPRCAPLFNGKAHAVQRTHETPQEIGCVGHPLTVTGIEYGTRW
jgi:hypothetical protein